MKISTYSGIGQRTNNEDYLIHSKGIYIVCDGVGGAEKGEVASRFVADTLLNCFESGPDGQPDQKSIQHCITETQKALSARLPENPKENGMGTTLTMLLLKKDSACIAHIGDSRVYFLRPSTREYWHTKDHSMVQELVDAGIITAEKARTHSGKNKITRAIQANPDGQTAIADVVKINELVAGDLFLLCSDGVMEAFDDDKLTKLLFRNDLSLENKLDFIKGSCEKESKDNHSAILIEIEAEDAFSHGNNKELVMLQQSTSTEEIDFVEITPLTGNKSEDPEDAIILQVTDAEGPAETSAASETNRTGSRFGFIKWFFIMLIVLIGIYYIMKELSGKSG